MKVIVSKLWEVLVPVADNNGVKFSVEHHQEWDKVVRATAGGQTIMPTAKGYWLDPEGILYSDRVIPVRIMCDEPAIRQIGELTLSHYGQLAVTAYLISDRAFIFEAE